MCFRKPGGFAMNSLLTLFLLLSMTDGVPAPPPVATFSIVAIDPDNGDLGVAVASRYFSVGSVVPWALAGVGAVATQANVNVGYGPLAIDLLRQGLSARRCSTSSLPTTPSRARTAARWRSSTRTAMSPPTPARTPPSGRGTGK